MSKCLVLFEFAPESDMYWFVEDDFEKYHGVFINSVHPLANELHSKIYDDDERRPMNSMNEPIAMAALGVDTIVHCGFIM